MKEDICSIPINDMFVSKCGCPVCRLYETVEKKAVEYIMGPAMMQPEIRVETNAKGFCDNHYSQMYNNYGKLQLALILQTHINEFNLNTNKEMFERVKSANNSCFVCEKTEQSFSKLVNQIFYMYEKDENFRTLFNSQSEFCLKHYKLLNERATKKVLKKQYKPFLNNLFNITKRTLELTENNINQFVKMYDYKSDKNADEFNGCKSAVEQALWFVSSNKYK